MFEDKQIAIVKFMFRYVHVMRCTELDDSFSNFLDSIHLYLAHAAFQNAFGIAYVQTHLHKINMLQCLKRPSADKVFGIFADGGFHI